MYVKQCNIIFWHVHYGGKKAFWFKGTYAVLSGDKHEKVHFHGTITTDLWPQTWVPGKAVGDRRRSWASGGQTELAQGQ